MTTRSIACLCVLSLGAAAQDMPAPPAPAPQIAKLERLLGHWRGEGTVVPMPGLPATQWRATAVARKMLGNHWILVDETIEFAGEGEAKMPDLAFRTFYGWDSQDERYVAHGISNMGTAESMEVFVDGDRITSAASKVIEGKPVLEHWTTTFTADGYDLLGRQSVGGGDFFTHVAGKMRRAGADAQAKAVDAAFTMGPPSDPEPMQRLAKAAGQYRLDGSMTMVPGEPAMPIGATASVQPIWGGGILEMKVKSDPSPAGDYEGYGAFAWDPRARSYTFLWVDSMCDANTSPAQWVDGKLVFRMSRVFQGTPIVQRGVIELNAEGAFQSETWTALSGTAAAYVTFAGTYARKQ